MQRMAVMAEQWHEKAPADMVLLFQTDLSLGLSEKVAEQRLKEVGPNLLSQQKRTSPFIIFLQQFESVVIWVLLGAVLVSFLLDEKADAIAILAIVILNAIIGFFWNIALIGQCLRFSKWLLPKQQCFAMAMRR